VNTQIEGIVTLGLEPSFGFGDRIGTGTPGHVAAMKEAGSGIAPIYPQQSIREMTRTGRSAAEVMGDALSGMQEAGWNSTSGADADHLKTRDDVDVTANAGFTFFTIDPSGAVDQQADNYSPDEVAEKFAQSRESASWYDGYLGKTVTLDSGTKIEFDELTCQRAAVKYGKAIEQTIAMSNYIKTVQEAANREFEIELSVDETEQPTSLAEHYIIAEQCINNEVKLVSLAPRFVGDFEKGVDYKGDLDALTKSLRDHAAIAKQLGPYKLSLHSGSDKLSIYTLFARETGGLWHVKTAGTSYLEAVRVAALKDEALFREIIRFARQRYETDRATYHVSGTLDDAPPPDDAVDIITLEKEYLELWDDVPAGKGFTKPGRQILHCTFGSVLTDGKLGADLKSLLKSEHATYTEVLRVHFAKHLEALQAGM